MTKEKTEAARELLRKGSYANIAITDGNEPYIITLNYGLDEKDDILYFCTEKSGMKLDFLKSNSYICGSVVIEKTKVTEEASTVFESCVFRGIIEVIHNKKEQLRAVNTIRYSPNPDAMINPMIMRLEIEEMERRNRKIPVPPC